MPVKDRSETEEALEKLATIAQLGGINMVAEPQCRRLAGEFTLPGGRSQVCFARLSARVNGRMVVTFYSACLKVKKGFLSGMSRDMAVDLLRRNEGMLFARYGLLQEEDGDMVVASADYLLDSLDPEEFEHAIWHVAMAADAYEKEKGGGKDEF